MTWTWSCDTYSMNESVGLCSDESTAVNSSNANGNNEHQWKRINCIYEKQIIQFTRFSTIDICGLVRTTLPNYAMQAGKHSAQHKRATIPREMPWNTKLIYLLNPKMEWQHRHTEWVSGMETKRDEKEWTKWTEKWQWQNVLHTWRRANGGRPMVGIHSMYGNKTNHPSKCPNGNISTQQQQQYEEKMPCVCVCVSPWIHSRFAKIVSEMFGIAFSLLLANLCVCFIPLYTSALQNAPILCMCMQQPTAARQSHAQAHAHAHKFTVLGAT